MFECPYCKPDSAGNHQPGCPNNTTKIVTVQGGANYIYPIYNPNDCRKIDPDKIPAAETASVTFVLDFGKSLDLVSISSEEYNRLKQCEAELAKYKAEAKSIPDICYRESCVNCGLKICPKYEGGEKGCQD